MAPIVFPLLVIGGGIVALLSRRNTAAAPAPLEPTAPPPAPVLPGPPPPILPGPSPILPPVPSTGGGSSAPPWTTVSNPSTAPWPSSLAVPTNLRAIPSSYLAQSEETSSIQDALNGWIGLVGAPVALLVVDGSYGPMTQQAAAAFQLWENVINPSANLTIDGLAGPETQNFLLDYGPIASGAY